MKLKTGLKNLAENYGVRLQGRNDFWFGLSGGFYKVPQVIHVVFLRDQIQDMRVTLVRAHEDLCEVFSLVMLVTGFVLCFKF